jgi:hypothetical protein
MKFPLIVISYGAFGADQKKLFLYENEGIPLFPVFSDPVIASQFCNGMQKVIKEHGDQRQLSTQVCSKKEHARDMLMVIMSIAPDVTTIIFDPSPPQGLNQSAVEAGVKPRDEMLQIANVIQDLEDSLSST